MSKRARRSASRSVHGSGPNTLRLPSSIHTSPSSGVSQLPWATRSANTWLNNAERAADSSSERWSGRIRRPPNIASAAGTLPPSRPKRCSPNQLGRPRAAISETRSSMAAASPCTSRSTSLKRLPASAPRCSLRLCQVDSITSISSLASSARSGATRLGRCTLKRWVVTALRSFMPA
ncbi:hypothetical protein D3C81_1739040 [compost metagenome]